MFPEWHQGRDRLDQKARKRAGPSPFPTPQSPGVCLWAGTPTKCPFRGVRGPGTGQPLLPDQETGGHCTGSHTTQGTGGALGCLAARHTAPAYLSAKCYLSSFMTVRAAAWAHAAHPDGPPANQQAQSPGTQPQKASFCLQSPWAPRSSEDRRVPQPPLLPEVGAKGTCWLSLDRLDLRPPLTGPVREASHPLARGSLSSALAWRGMQCVPPASSCSRQA